MTAALRKIDSPQPRRYRQRVSAQNPRSKVTYLPLVSPEEFSGPPEGFQGYRVSTKPSLANNETPKSITRQNLPGKIANLGNPWAKPIWLRSLLRMKTGTAIAMLILVSAVVGLYSKVVYTKQHWGQEYRKLERLQKEERQVTIFNEALKNDIAQTAKKGGTGLVPPNGSQMIVLEPSPVRPWQETALAQPENFQSGQPLGY